MIIAEVDAMTGTESWIAPTIISEPVANPLRPVTSWNRPTNGRISFTRRLEPADSTRYPSAVLTVPEITSENFLPWAIRPIRATIARIMVGVCSNSRKKFRTAMILLPFSHKLHQTVALEVGFEFSFHLLFVDHVGDINDVVAPGKATFKVR